MQRLLAGLVIALACHALLLIVPIQHHQASRSRLPKSSGITVGFSRIEPLSPRNEVRSIPPPPEPISPLKERIEKTTARKKNAAKIQAEIDPDTQTTQKNDSRGFGAQT